jgi:hypothetical protein
MLLIAPKHRHGRPRRAHRRKPLGPEHRDGRRGIGHVSTGDRQHRLDRADLLLGNGEIVRGSVCSLFPSAKQSIPQAPGQVTVQQMTLHFLSLPSAFALDLFGFDVYTFPPGAAGARSLHDSRDNEH